MTTSDPSLEADIAFAASQKGCTAIDAPVWALEYNHLDGDKWSNNEYCFMKKQDRSGLNYLMRFKGMK
ncbi:hypothetical protein Syun_014166 [Stephania yunnanensis]|uniref:Uncharacterized protein n=1 Tax=Stephania yunnanensis TaxID=152371 RepID=A0AAP0JJW7_9MAGN